MSKYLVTGTAVFIDFHLANALLEKGEEVVGLDNINGILAVLDRLVREESPVLMNIGNNHPVTVTALVLELESVLGRRAIIEYLPMQPGDLNASYAI